MFLGLVALIALPSQARAEVSDSNCYALGIGLLNPYFNLPWSNDYAGGFSKFVAGPSAAAYWGVERQNPTGDALTGLDPHNGISVLARGTLVDGRAIRETAGEPMFVSGGNVR